MNTSGILGQLKAETRLEHDLIEHELAMHKLPQAGHRARILQAFLNFHASWEDAVVAAVPVADSPLFKEGSRWHHLMADADQFGLRARPVELPKGLLDRADRAWGSAYVLWGSMLGGRVLFKQLAPSPHDGSIPAGWHYFHGHGNATGSLWHEFCRQLEANFERDAWSTDEAAWSAKQTFEALRHAVVQSADPREVFLHGPAASAYV